jgi:trehalose-6-phosphate synthase
MAVTTAQQKIDAAALVAKAAPAIAANITYLAIASPSVAQNTAQLKALTRQTNALMRLVAGMYGAHAQLVNGADT